MWVFKKIKIMNLPFFSIIIPTRNRSETLYYSVLTVLNQSFSDFEIIISDNSEDNLTIILVSKIKDKRIR